MKIVYLIRHAKSSWDDARLSDIERPLNQRGLKDAPAMARIMLEKGVKPDLILSSPANRAKTTAIFFKETLGVPDDRFRVEPEVYEAMSQTILHLIQTLPDEAGTVLIFGHNPTFTTVANLFTNEYIDNVPTCGITGLEANVRSWADFSPKNGRLFACYFPGLMLRS